MTKLFFVTNKAKMRRSVLANDADDAADIVFSAGFAKSKDNLTVEEKSIDITFNESQSKTLAEHANIGERGMLSCSINGNSHKWNIFLPGA